MPGVELVSACYRERSFPENSHSEYVVGAVVSGAETLTVAGFSHRVGAGGVLLLDPDEAHGNATIGPDALRYHVLYLHYDAVHAFVDHERQVSLRFPVPMSDSQTLFATVTAAHAVLRSGTAGALEQESALSRLVRTFTVLTNNGPATISSPSAHADRIADAKAFIEENYAKAFSLHDLAGFSGLSIFHFARSFKNDRAQSTSLSKPVSNF